MKVVIIGSGNVATVLGRKIVLAGHEIIQVAGRNEESMATLSSILKTDYTNNLFKISSLADIYIIAVSDSVIEAITSDLTLSNKLVVHTAAAVSKDVLSSCSTNYGVLYPLQSLKKEVTSIPEIPIVVDGSTDETREELKRFALSWTDNVLVANDEERLKLHLAAVFVNNFTNHLFAVSAKFCRANQLDFNLLQPIIEETITRIGEYPPSVVQTGPARRKDFATIQKHQKLLGQYPHAQKLYDALTTSIIEFYRGNKL